MPESVSYNSETIYHTLKAEILNLILKPGQKLSEHELSARFAVSRTPVRSALQRLQADGLMAVVPYKGSTVTLLDYDDIQQMLYMRVAVESAVIRDFMEVCTPLLLEKVRYMIRRQTALLGGEFEASQFYEMDSQMHAVWFGAVKRDRLWQMMLRSEVSYRRFRMLDIVAVKKFKQIAQEHQELFDIIERKAAGEVEPLIRRHLYGGIERLRGYIETDFRDYFILDAGEKGGTPE